MMVALSIEGMHGYDYNIMYAHVHTIIIIIQ